MRSVFAALLLVIGLAASAGAEPPRFRAGVVRIALPDPPLAVLVWYPSEAAEQPWQAGPWPVAATQGAPVAAGQRFPVVLFSHGGGPGGGNPLLHRDLGAHFARSGFIVVMPAHGNEPPRLVLRPQQLRRALAATLADPRFAAAADPARLGMIGFSLGGATALIAAGAVPDYPRYAAYCREHPGDVGACDGGSGGTGAPAPSAAEASALPVRALVLLDPLAALFGAPGLAGLTMPVLLYRPAHSGVLRPEGNALALAAALPRPPEQMTVPGNHWIFVDPCPPVLQAEAVVCRDAAGVDRAAIHRAMEVRITAFLRDNL
ncbi:alpha/beta hydrolase family protein [Plastoroseomonas hellenica]|uniref:alpha/beta hydrolase family protein n=1 Tax=Plastoroseomonas hellenica TaxID=2687306 RepID=UPI001BAD8422|nr:hypothetical protein [Plastoroseomonas hellenica]MBR0646289.1 dienelactone hydrolase [Plastoroseomonas hellenica]